ncbi:MAG: hypothetical protein ACRDS0_15145 [Pseudonocardiaceae bacterium]
MRWLRAELAGPATLDSPDPSLVWPTTAVRRNHPVKPLIHGYLRITENLDDDLQQLERGLAKLVEP